MRRIRLSALAALAIVAVTTAGASAAGKARTERGQLVHDIVLKWAPHVQEAYRGDARAWAMELVPLFTRATLPQLQRAREARTFDQMNNELFIDAPGGATALVGETGAKPRITARVLGDVDKDLIYVPITPCRIIDTRLAGGQIAANTSRAFDVTAVSNYSFQGGDASNCGGAGAAGSFAAAAINFTVVTPSIAGYMTAYPFGATQPLAATVNYTAGDIRGNFAVVRLDQTAAANELSIYTFGATHVVADLVGYYINPGPLVFECVNSGETINSVNAGATSNAVAPACPATYVQTATNCETSTWQMPFVYISEGTCSAQNNSSGIANLRASRTCCRARRT